MLAAQVKVEVRERRILQARMIPAKCKRASCRESIPMPSIPMPSSRLFGSATPSSRLHKTFLLSSQALAAFRYMCPYSSYMLPYKCPCMCPCMCFFSDQIAQDILAKQSGPCCERVPHHVEGSPTCQDP